MIRPPVLAGTGVAVGTGLRKYWKTAAMTATSYAGDSLLFLVDYLMRLLRVLVLLALWRTLAGRGVESTGMTLASLLTYTLIAEVFAEQLAVRTSLETALWEGSIATRFLRPVGMFGQLTAEMVGRWGFGFVVFSLPLLCAAPLLGVNPLPANLEAGVLFAVSLLLAISVGLAVEFIFGALMVFLESSVYAVNRLRAAVVTLLSGALVPLALLPPGLGAVFEWLPFAAMASAPLRIYTGTGNAWFLIPLQAGWSVVLWPAAHLLWRANRQRLVSYGG